VIIEPGGQTHATYLVAEGLAQALVSSQDGQCVLVHEYRRGDFFGAGTELEPEPERADIVAFDEVRAAVIRLPQDASSNLCSLLWNLESECGAIWHGTRTYRSNP
jgi:CRP-like cAMP-binding protein